ncbi:vacuolar protein sorting-associated protein 13C [Agrilus planipennis]|uniref:Vacuolar protein sorting-associated protein 13C n=1 Tax=Agrilus planipennis TaxID=224129 RepID=A0A7F5QZ31_AGRPL|nr:vacuolar protein sorting-associated protein 13C [Agrilus planipennis]
MGTIGKIWLQIPWNRLWSQPVVVNIENIHILAKPIVRFEKYDSEKDKRLLRAFKRRALGKLDSEGFNIGGPQSFAEHLVANIVNNMQITLTNIHIRYEDTVSVEYPIACGFCIGSISAEPTNSKWKACKVNESSTTCYYLVKVEALYTYWNVNITPPDWNFPSDYYTWRNSMASSMQNFSFNGEDFDFVLKPMTLKMKMTINKSETGNITKINSDMVVHDCSIQISKDQYYSILETHKSLSRMLISWNYLSLRPSQAVLKNKKAWWRYACQALLEQRIRPYTWTRVKNVREHYKKYIEAYKVILMNPNDTELKLDLQKHEDNLTLLTIVIARQQAKRKVELFSLTDKSLWVLLPSPEKSILCEKIGFSSKFSNKKEITIEHKYQFRMGNLCVSFLNPKRIEILMITLTQIIATFVPCLKDDTYNLSLKMEGIVVEGANANEHLTPVLYSEHAPDSPAYFFKLDLEKKPNSYNCTYKLTSSLSTIEVVYDMFAMKKINNYLGMNCVTVESMLEIMLVKLFQIVCRKINEKVNDFWDINLNLKVPIFIIPEDGNIAGNSSLLILDLGRIEVTTELWKRNDVLEFATQMEMEEQLYSRLHIKCSDIQVLFGNSKDNWKESMKEKDTELHILPKTKISAFYALRVRDVSNIPRYKFSSAFENFKINIREKRLEQIFDYFDSLLESKRNEIPQNRASRWLNDTIFTRNSYSYHCHVLSIIKKSTGLSKPKSKDNSSSTSSTNQDKKRNVEMPKQDMNEAFARVIDLPGLEDNISPNNTIRTLLRFSFNEFTLTVFRSNAATDKQYLILRLHEVTVDLAYMTYGPAYQVSVRSICLTDKCHTTCSGQYLDLIHSPFPSKEDIFVLLYRRVDAKCPDFWTHFHGVETSLVADFDTVHLTLHQEATENLLKYTKYLCYTICSKLSGLLIPSVKNTWAKIKASFSDSRKNTPVPPGAVKYSQSGRLNIMDIKVCASDFDIMGIQISGLEVDLLFRANERFVFKSFLRHISVDHLSEVTLYPKILTTDGEKVYEVKYVQNATHIVEQNQGNEDKIVTNGTFKFYLGRLHITFLYKLIVQFQRFLLGMEMISCVESLYEIFSRNISKITETLKPNSKIHLAINLQGPVILFPQKSDSPNVIIVDTGELHLENFFKRYSNDVVDNILVKLDQICLSRAVMGLTANIEMQETMLEPLGLNLDVKSYVSQSNSLKTNISWEVDGNLDVIQINVGQRDLSTLIACYTDNIGEGKLLNLLPEKKKVPIKEDESLEAVKKLESFFCKPKQKDISLKFSLDGLHVTLFFDPSELLSSPIRDLNHGFCKIELAEIALYVVVYTDKTLEGKFNAEMITIEELGPDVNTCNKYILQSTAEDSANNNAKVTINKPPVIDITFTQNKSNDKSVDTIIGSLSLSLSVPFCEKIAIFILESLPKENTDLGIVNHGYISDHSEQEPTVNCTSSLTVALRINKPEFIFVIESTSKKQKYFITRSEVLLDYSRHNNTLNLVLSLSGIHTLFYDSGLSYSDSYVVLKRCEIELARNYSEDKGEKISLSVSPIQIHICDRVVHSITDILHDIAEHFRVPDQTSRKSSRAGKRFSQKSFEHDDLWESKKLPETQDELKNIYVNPKPPVHKIHQVFLMSKTDFLVVLHLEETPVFMLKSSIEMTICGWSHMLNSTCQVTLQANYFNENAQEWEPFVDPVVVNECEYKPWEIMIKVFQDRAMPIITCPEIRMQKDTNKNQKRNLESFSGDEDSDEEMVYMEPPTTLRNNQKRRITTSLSSLLQESDSETEEGSNDKLMSAISDLFTGDWNESEASSVEQSSSDEDENFDEDSTSHSKSNKVETDADFFEKATYVILDGKETLNITITPSLLKVIKDLNISYFGKTLSMIHNKSSINIVNEIGPNTKIELLRRNSKDNSEEYVLLDSKTYESQDSYPSSPTRENCDISTKESDELAKMDADLCCSFEIAECFDFPPQTTATLYESAQRHFLKVYVPGFLPMQTNCPKRAWEKLISLQSVSNPEMYYLVAKHTVGKIKTITVSSPLEIRNETCFAMSVFYEPAILQKLNLEPIGYMKNPFEPTMRMAVLEPHEQFHVPLFIAFHCKLFIQPAYAETYYVSDEGLYWKTLATEFDTPNYIVCKPKDKTNQEVFSLKVELEKNVSIRHSYSQSIPNYIIRLLPPLVLQNYLPYAIEVQNIDLKQHLKIEPAELSSIYSVDMSKDQKFLLKVILQGTLWSGVVSITKELDEKVVALTSERKSNMKQLLINVKANKGNNIVYVYVPYWIINKTGLPLELKISATNSIFKNSKGDITLLTFKPNMKRTITVKVYDSKWSNDFGLDAAGTTGLIVCKDVHRSKRYCFILSISLSKTCPMLTKIVYFLPTFLVSNNTNKFLRFMEVNEKTDLWIDLPPNETFVFWPETSSMQMQVKYRDSTFISQAFSITSRLLTVLRMDKGSALTVLVEGGKTDPFCISFHKYQSGDAPVLIKNMCPEVYLKIQQSEQPITHVLNPNHSLLFTWDEPSKSRQLIWNVYNNRGHGFFIDIEKNGFGEEKINQTSNGRRFRSQQSSSTNDSSNEESDSVESILKSPINKTRKNKFKIYWICYYNGTQRVLVFSQQNSLVQQIKDTNFVEMCHTEFLLSLSGLAISVFSQHNLKKELACLSLTSSPATWEVNVGHKWKTLTVELASWIEDKYRLGYKKCQLKDYIHIDFEKMFMLKPFLAELRRSHNSAVYLQHRKSKINQQVNLLLNFLQIDNKYSSSVILRPMPAGNLKNVMPFVELSCVFSFNKDCWIIKDFRANMQQFSCSIENHFNMRLGELFTENWKISEDVSKCYIDDIKEIRKPVENYLKEKYDKKIVIESMKISDIFIQINFANRPEEPLRCIHLPFAKFLSYTAPLQLLPFVPAQNVQHRIAYYECSNIRKSFQQLVNEVWQNFKCQFLQQFYVHVLGIQVLINPYAFPIISSPSIRSLEDVVPTAQLNGYRCLLGHLNMSTAALEQMISNVFSNQMLDNIYRLGRHGSYQKNYFVPTAVLDGYRNFHIGVTLALEQLIIKNNRGVLYDGETFFKSTGKALLSLITRHPDDKSNSIVIATEALHRAALLNEPIHIQQRLTRYCNIYMGLKPFSGYESVGNYLTETIQNGRFAGDVYWAYAALNKNTKSIVIVTLQHLIKINKCRLWGPWEVDWCLELDDVISVPKITENCMLLNVKKVIYTFLASNINMSSVGTE